MTKKDFKAIAFIINLHRNRLYSSDKMELFNSLEEELCDYFKKVNNKFDKDKFLNACK